MPSSSSPTLRERRDELDLTNHDLAERLSISYGYLNNILGGLDAPSNRLVHRLAEALKMPVDDVRAQVRTRTESAGRNGGTQGDPSTPPAQPPRPKSPTQPSRPTGSRRA